MKITKVMSYLLSIVVLISIAIGVNGCMSEQDEILEYLEEKYGQQFEVERYWSEYDGTSKLSHEMLVYPAGQSQLLFRAGKFRDPIEQKDILWDNYIKVKWSMEYSEKHKAKLLAIDEREMDLEFFVNVAGDPPVKYLNLGMENYLASKQGKEAKPSGIIAIVIKAGREPNKSEEIKFIYKIYKSIQSLGLRTFTLDVTYVKSSGFSQATKLLKLMQGDEQVSIRAVGEENLYQRVTIFNTDKIQKAEDIMSCFDTGE